MTADYRGARWWRCDLHVHTPFDGRRFGEDVQGALAALEKGNDARIREIAARFFAACTAVDVVGVTDHNSIHGYRTLKPYLDEVSETARATGDIPPVFLPGVEITAGAERPMHFLVLFGQDCSPRDIDALISVVFGANQTHAQDGTPRPSGKSVADFLGDLKAYCTPDDGERRLPFLVVPAHIDRDAGLANETGTRDLTGPDLFQEMRGVLRERALTRAGWHGFQTSQSYDRLPQALRDLLCVWEANRQERRWDDLGHDEQTVIRDLEHWPLIEASDPEVYDHIGRRYTWLKMAERDLEGVRLALLDPASRLRRMAAGEPGADYPQIRFISIRETDFLNELEVAFSPNLNAIIGGRGSGKSTVVELLRYGLGRDNAGDFDRAEQETRDAVAAMLNVKPSRDFGSTPGTLLAATTVEIGIAVAGVDYVARRTPESLTVERSNGPDVELPDGMGLDVRTLIRPQILSQGQISRIARDPTAQRREIDRIAAGDMRVSDFDRLRAGLAALIEQSQTDLRGALDDQRQLAPTLTELQTVSDGLELLESGASQEVLQRYRIIAGEVRRLQGWRDSSVAVFEHLKANVAEARSASEQISANEDVPAFVTAQAERERIALDVAAESVDAAADQLKAAQDESDRLEQVEWVPLREEAEEAYRQLVGQLRAQGVSLDEHEALIGQKSVLEERARSLQLSADRIEDLEGTVIERWSELAALHVARSNARSDVSGMLTEQNADIRLRIIPFGDRESIDERRAEWFGGTNLHIGDWELVLDWVFSSDEGIAERWRDLVQALIRDRRSAEDRDSSELTSISQLLGQSVRRLSGHIQRSIPRMVVDRLESMLRTLPEDRVEADVRDPDGEFKPMQQGSLGQRSTAILSLVLSAGNQPLVIDQPEEDLDNQYVYSVVVGLLRNRKFSRQLILATHNANIPVNGDAELILSLGVSARLGVISSVGSIDQEPVKADVNSILEGSAEAFRLRRRRYGF